MMQIVYTQPAWGFLSFIAVAIVLLYVFLNRFRKRVIDRFGTIENIKKTAHLRSRRFFWLRVFCIAFAFLFATFALMEPMEFIEEKTDVEKTDTQAAREGVDELVFIIDVSASMGSLDTRENNSRLSRAKEIVDATIKYLGGVNISLYAFAGDAKSIVPPTMDYLYFRILLQSLQINETGIPGTDFSVLVNQMKEKYFDSKIKKKVR